MRNRRSRLSRLLWAAILVGVVLSHAQAASAQVKPSGGWAPLGQLPVDQGGAGLRGYALAGEDTEVTASGANQFSFHGLASNNLYREETPSFLVLQRHETHTATLGYRRGFAVAGSHRGEIGGHVQLHQRDGGFLNGFITGFEDVWVAVTGNDSSKNVLRTSSATLPPLGTLVRQDGRAIYRDDGRGSGFGDVYVVAKLVLADGQPSSKAARVSARLAVNIAGTRQFSAGNFAGIGVSLDRKLVSWAAFHGDVRATLILDRSSVWNLPLKRASVGFSIGPEFKLTRNSSLSLQYDGASTPYTQTGTLVFDKGYGDITLGAGFRKTVGGRALVVQLYARENLNLPLSVRPNVDPDVSFGLKVTLR